MREPTKVSVCQCLTEISIIILHLSATALGLGADIGSGSLWRIVSCLHPQDQRYLTQQQLRCQQLAFRGHRWCSGL